MGAVGWHHPLKHTWALLTQTIRSPTSAAVPLSTRSLSAIIPVGTLTLTLRLAPSWPRYLQLPSGIGHRESHVGRVVI